MKPLFSPFQIAVLLGALAITAVFLWLRIPTVEYCELSNNPQRYDGKTLRLKSKLSLSMHGGYYFTDRNCSDDGDNSRIAISFSPENSNAERDIQEKLLKSGKGFNYSIDIVAVGKFTYRNELGNSGAIRDTTHLQFELQEIEFAEK